MSKKSVSCKYGKISIFLLYNYEFNFSFIKVSVFCEYQIFPSFRSTQTKRDCHQIPAYCEYWIGMKFLPNTSFSIKIQYRRIKVLHLYLIYFQYYIIAFQRKKRFCNWFHEKKNIQNHNFKHNKTRGMLYM